MLLRTNDTAVVNDENRASDNNFSVTCHNVTTLFYHVRCRGTRGHDK